MQAHNGMNANRTNDLKRFACIEKSIRAPIHPSQFGGDAIECYLKPHNRMGTNVCDTMLLLYNYLYLHKNIGHGN